MNILATVILVGILSLLVAYQRHLKRVQQRNTINAVLQVIEQVTFDPYKKPRLFDANIPFEDWKQLSLRNKARVRQSLNLNVLAMLEHERLKRYRYEARRLDRAAGLGGPTWTTSSPYSSKQTLR